MKQTTNEIDSFRDQIKSLKSTVFQLHEKVSIIIENIIRFHEHCHLLVIFIMAMCLLTLMKILPCQCITVVPILIN